MSNMEPQRESPTLREHVSSEPSPLTLPPARLREPSADDLEIDVSDTVYDLPLDDSDRLYEDAEPLKD